MAFGGAQIETECACGGEAIGHDAFAAGLIDRRHAGIGECDIDTAATRGEGDGKSGGTSANDEEIGGARQRCHRSNIDYAAGEAKRLTPECIGIVHQIYHFVYRFDELLHLHFRDH